MAATNAAILGLAAASSDDAEMTNTIVKLQGSNDDMLARTPAASREDVVAKLRTALAYAEDEGDFDREAVFDILRSATRDWQDLHDPERLAA